MGVDVVMAIRVPKKLTKGEVLKQAVLMAKSLGHYKFWIYTPEDGFDDGRGRHCLSIEGGEYYGIEAAKNETIISAHIATRYYGPGYERGDLAIITETANWLRHVWPESTIYYGGDSGQSIDILDEAAEKALWDHLLSEHGRDYYEARRFSDGQSHSCTFCKDKASEMGRDLDGRTIYFCNGCGRYISWNKEKHSYQPKRTKHGQDNPEQLPSGAYDAALLDAVARVIEGNASVEEASLLLTRNSPELTIKVSGVRTDQLYDINILERAGMTLINEFDRRSKGGQ